MTPASLRKRAAKIKLILFDCDGVLTDGGLYVAPDGEETRRFHVHDGYAIKMLRDEGIRTGVVSGRDSAGIRARAEHLQMEFIRIGRFDKREAVEEILNESGLSPEEVAFVGDDVFDLPAMEIVGLAVTVANGRPEVKEKSDYVSAAPGGNGAVREIVEMILEARRPKKPSGKARKRKA